MVSLKDKFAKSIRGEREYYQSKKSMKEKLKLPITLDGCEALLEIVTEVMEIPLDDTIRQVFAGYVHHLPQLENGITLSDVTKLLYKHKSNHATWIYDQDSKQREKKALEDARLKALEEEKLKEDTKVQPLTLAKDADETKEESPDLEPVKS